MPPITLVLFALLVATLPLSGADAAAPVVGRASVIDGDTLDLGGVRIRLHGLDAPESSQTCLDAEQRSWPCGRRAAQALDDALLDRTVRCTIHDRDRYGRAIAVCRVGDVDVNDWLVRQGWAVAYRRYSIDYVDAERAAAAAGRGMWRGAFDYPWDWRANRRSATSGSTSTVTTAGKKPTCKSFANRAAFDAYVRQHPDEFGRFDRDRDGIGCESLR